MQQFKALGAQRRCDDAYTGDIAARSLRLATRPSLTGLSLPLMKTIGILAVAALAACAGALPPAPLSLPPDG